ncbi:hypothetical protein GCM10009078_45450 [Cupriavidus gilardii]
MAWVRGIPEGPAVRREAGTNRENDDSATTVRRPCAQSREALNRAGPARLGRRHIRAIVGPVSARGKCRARRPTIVRITGFFRAICRRNTRNYKVSFRFAAAPGGAFAAWDPGPGRRRMPDPTARGARTRILRLDRLAAAPSWVPGLWRPDHRPAIRQMKFGELSGAV